MIWKHYPCTHYTFWSMINLQRVSNRNENNLPQHSVGIFDLNDIIALLPKIL